jgi:antitoxin (DNA-binding transcriptional repressor) of toxin-antitoxin stability system
MHAVGLRELKAKLGEYVRKAAAGEVVLVTERGRVVAELRAPITTRDLPPAMAGLAALAERGLLTLGLPGKASYPRTGIRVPAGTARRLLDEERQER